MKVLGNDYLSNLPGARRKGQGGPARFSSQLVKALASAGDRYVGIATKNVGAAEPSVQTAGRRDGARYYRLKFPRVLFLAVTRAKRPVSPRRVLQPVIDEYKRLIAKEKPDVVFINGFNVHVWPLLVAAYESHVPIILQHAGVWQKEIEAYADRFPAGARRMFLAMERDIPRLATVEVFLNETSKRVFQSVVARVPRAKSVVIPLPMTEHVSNFKRRKPEKTIRIGVVARWDRIKNHEAILALAKRIKERGLPWETHVISRLPPISKNLRFAREYRKHVDVHRPTDHAGVLQFFRSMDIALLPSHFETAGAVVLEADSQNLGTIISKTVGWADTYRKTGNSAWIADFSRPDQVIKKIERLAGTHLSSAFRSFVRKYHRPARVFRAYLNLFQRVSR